MTGAGNATLTLGTAGHVDHGKTALVGALTGVNTDRLPAERERGLSIELGYAPLTLPGGRRLSVVDVPGHERFVRTMVSGATGIDLFCLVVAADDGVMAQTREHAAVLAALGVSHGIVVVTKADLADPERARREAAELLPGCEVVVCSPPTGEGLAAVTGALERVAGETLARRPERPPVLHVDRVFSVRGAGTVVTGTLWSGTITLQTPLVQLPSGRELRLRAIEVHGTPVERAEAGQRVALNLTGVRVRDVLRGDAIVAPGAGVEPTLILDATLVLDGRARHGARVQVHHGTRAVAARLVALEGTLWQLRLDRSLLAATGDRIVVRSIAPADTLGGGTVLDARARRHGARAAGVIGRLRRIERGEREPTPAEVMVVAAGVGAVGDVSEPSSAPVEPSTALPVEAIALAERLRIAAHEPPSAAELADAVAHLPALREAGVAIRLGRDLHIHADALADVRARVTALLEVEETITLARLRDELGTSRRYAQALLEHLDSASVTLRLPDDSRRLRRSARG